MSEDGYRHIMPEYELAPRVEYWVIERHGSDMVENIPAATFPSSCRDRVREFCDAEYDKWAFIEDAETDDDLDAVVTEVGRYTRESEVRLGP